VGVVFGQPLRAKTKWFQLKVPLMEEKLQLPRPLVLDLGWSNRDEAFTTTRGATQSLFDVEAAGAFLGRYFGSKDSPQAATTRVGRFWGTLRAATDAAMLASGMDSCYRFYANCFVVHIYNRTSTTASKLATGVAPCTYLELDEGLEKPVPFGNPCSIAIKSTWLQIGGPRGALLSGHASAGVQRRGYNEYQPQRASSGGPTRIL